jgi:cytidine deaminase
MSAGETPPDDEGSPAGAMARLLAAAWAARDAAICTYSGFAVGAAIEDGEGRLWTGANVENASYTLGLCAERVAMFYALTHGARDFRRVVVVTDTPKPTSPCGACRQILWEFARDAEIVLANRHGDLQHLTMPELVPHAFDDTALRR